METSAQWHTAIRLKQLDGDDMYFNQHLVYDFNDIMKTAETKVSFGKQLRDGGDIPAYVMDNKEKILDPSSIPASQFGLVIKEAGQIHKRFPLNDKGSSWLSQQSFVQNFQNIPLYSQAKTARCIKEACAHYEINIHPFIHESSQYATDESNFTDFDETDVKVAEDELSCVFKYSRKFALETEGRYPLNTNHEIKVACDYFIENYEDLNEYGKAKEYASNLKTACIKSSVSVPDEVNAYCDDHTEIDLNVLKFAFDERTSMCEKYDWDEEKTANAKLAYQSIYDDAPYSNKMDLVKRILRADEKFFKIAQYNHFASPRKVVFDFAKDATSSEGQTLERTIEESGQANAHSQPSGNISKHGRHGNV